MAVLEFALIKLRNEYDELDLLETLMQCQEVQDSWIRYNLPHHGHHTANASNMYIDKSPTSDSPTLLITALWESPEAHGEWIQSTENQNLMSKLSDFIAPGSGSTLLVHLSPAGKVSRLSDDFLARQDFRVCVVPVETSRVEELQSLYRKLEGGDDEDEDGNGNENENENATTEKGENGNLMAPNGGSGGSRRNSKASTRSRRGSKLSIKAPKQRIWAGWKVEKTGDTEDLVVFWADDMVPQEHIDKLAAMSERCEHRLFQHIVPGCVNAADHLDLKGIARSDVGSNIEV